MAFLGANYLMNTAIFIMVFIIMAQSFNLVVGYTRMVHVGHVAFMAIGAYGSALMSLHGFPFWMSALTGVGIATMMGLLLGIPTVRFRADYLVVATLGLGEIVRSVIINWSSLTRGPLGLPGIPRPTIFGMLLDTNGKYFVFMLIVTVLVNVLVWRIVKSPFGRVLETIREDEIASLSIGKNVVAYKLIALMLGAGIAGLAGVLEAHFVTFTEPNIFNLSRMMFVFLIVMFGGAGTFWGPIVGSTIVYTVFELARFLPFPNEIVGAMRWVFYSLVLIIILIFKPNGIMGKKWLRKRY